MPAPNPIRRRRVPPALRNKYGPWALLAGILGFLELALLSALPNKFWLPDMWYWILLGLTSSATVAVVGVVCYQESKVRQLARKSDFRLCLNCAHVLTGLPDDGNCPECGKPYRLEDNQKHWRHVLRLNKS